MIVVNKPIQWVIFLYYKGLICPCSDGVSDLAQFQKYFHFYSVYMIACDLEKSSTSSFYSTVEFTCTYASDYMYV